MQYIEFLYALYCSLILQVSHWFSGIWFPHSCHRSGHQGHIGVYGSEIERYHCFSVFYVFCTVFSLICFRCAFRNYSDPFTFITMFALWAILPNNLNISNLHCHLLLALMLIANNIIFFLCSKRRCFKDNRMKAFFSATTYNH